MSTLRITIEIPDMELKDAVEVEKAVKEALKDYEKATVSVALVSSPPPLPVPPPAPS